MPANEPPVRFCRKCGHPIARDQYRFGSHKNGWEHMAGECPIEPPFDSPEERAEYWADTLGWGGDRKPATEPPFISKAEYIEPTTIDEARQQMCAELHRALYGDVWARPQSARDVWVDMLERIDRASRALRR